jgi:hypothetical protein
LLIFIFLVLVSGIIIFLYKQKRNIRKNIFEITYLKNKKIKNRIFFGAVFDASFEEGKMQEKLFKE